MRRAEYSFSRLNRYTISEPHAARPLVGARGKQRLEHGGRERLLGDGMQPADHLRRQLHRMQADVLPPPPPLPDACDDDVPELSAPLSPQMKLQLRRLSYLSLELPQTCEAA